MCPSCDADLSSGEDEWAFCPYCGAPLDPDFGGEVIVGIATEDSIQDPFTGEVTVEVRLL